MTTRKLVEYVFAQAEKFGWETQIEGTGICDADGYEQHLLLWRDHYEMEFYYYIKPKNNGYDYSITNTPLTSGGLEYTTKEEIDEYFRNSGPSLKELRNHFLNMFS